MNHLSAEQQAILQLLRQSLWGESPLLPHDANWERISTIAIEQGVLSLVYDGAVKCNAQVPDELQHKWKDKMFRGAVKNELLMYEQKRLVSWLAQDGISAVVLKGSSVARYYPQPELRVLGDIDILVRESNLERAIEILEQHGYAQRESDHEFHIGLCRKGIYVELHYYVTGFPDSPGGRAAREETAKFLDEICQGTVSDYVFPVLSDQGQALSLLLHMIRHMFSTGIGLRQVCDWATYIVWANSEGRLKNVLPMLRRCGLLRYAKVATKTCICYLGVPEKGLAWCDDVADEDCRAFIEEVFRVGNMGIANNGGMESLFTNDSTMGKKESALCALLTRLTELAYKHFPLARKCKVLLPVFWIYLPIRYWVRTKLGLRPKKSVIKVVASAKKQRNLYEMLEPFELDDQSV